MSDQEKVKIVTDENFDSIVRSSSVVIIDCWAPWCGPCRMISPIIEELSDQYFGKAIFGKLNVDENSLIATRFRIMAIPTILFFKRGQHVDSIVGAVAKSIIEAKIDALE